MTFGNDEIFPAVFLDRDGTINREKHYLYKIADFEFYHGVIDAIWALNKAGYLVFVVTNQSGIARGFYSEEDVKFLHKNIEKRLQSCGARVDKFYYCPHHPEGSVREYRNHCDCRKPGLGMFNQAVSEFEIDIGRSWMIGDRLSDMDFGLAAGLSSILVETGYGRTVTTDFFRLPTLTDAVKYILRQEK